MAPFDAAGLREQLAGATRRASIALESARRSATTIIEHVPGAARATRAGAQRTTTALQRLPDSTLRLMAVGSIGVAAGFRVAGAPRLATAIGVAPALLAGAAIALRPAEPLGQEGITARSVTRNSALAEPPLAPGPGRSTR